jgi:bifunctional DNA primase/polymerase-like protein
MPTFAAMIRRTVRQRAKPAVKTGGGGAHLYLRCPPDKLPSDPSVVLRQSPDKVDDKPVWTIELLSGGHAVTLPPSIHLSGQPYEWVNIPAPQQRR